jgi:hypothetical protein
MVSLLSSMPAASLRTTNVRLSKIHPQLLMLNGFNLKMSLVSGDQLAIGLETSPLLPTTHLPRVRH